MKKTLLSLVAVAAISGAAGVQAEAEEIVVHKGDTLWGFAQEYDVSVESIKEWNKLSDDRIRPNDVLEVSPVKHIEVRRGDTLWDIATLFGVTADDLKVWNQINTDTIRPGMRLVIYTEMPEDMKVKAASSESTIESTPAPAKPLNAGKAAVKKPASAENELVVEATAYTAECKGCSGTTKTGVNLKENPDAKVIAVDPSIIPLGSKVYVEGYGYAIAADTGGAIKGKRIDVFIPKKADANDWGSKKVKVTVVN